MCLFLASLAFYKKLCVNLYQTQNTNFEFFRYILQFLLAIKFGSNLVEKLEPEGVMERGSHISYTRTLEEQTLVYLPISPPNLSIMLVCDDSADPVFDHFGFLRKNS